MSKPIRIRGFVADPVAVLAEAENRSFANMVEVLLLAALTERDQEVRDNGANRTAVASSESLPPTAVRGVKAAGGFPRSVSADVAATIPGVKIVRPHMKLRRPAVECPTRWPSGVCPDCGTVVT